MWPWVTWSNTKGGSHLEYCKDWTRRSEVIPLHAKLLWDSVKEVRWLYFFSWSQHKVTRYLFGALDTSITCGRPGASSSKGGCALLTPLSSHDGMGMQRCQDHSSLWGLLVRKKQCLRAGKTHSAEASWQASPQGQLSSALCWQSTDWTALLVSAQSGTRSGIPQL